MMDSQDKKQGSVIRSCNCPHEYQDKKHGKGRRVFNLCVKQGSSNGARCTVCGKQVS